MQHWPHYVGCMLALTVSVTLAGCVTEPIGQSRESDDPHLEPSGAVDCQSLYPDWVADLIDDFDPNWTRTATTDVLAVELDSAKAETVPFAALTLADVDVECATAFVEPPESAPANHPALHETVVRAEGVSRDVFAEVGGMLIALGYTLTDDTVPVEVAGEAGAPSTDVEPSAAPTGAETEWYRRFEAPRNADDNGKADNTSTAITPGDTVWLWYYPLDLQETRAGLLVVHYRPSADPHD